MDPNLIPDIMATALCVVPLFIALRAFRLYSQSRSPRLFILGLAMAMITLTAADNLFVNFVTVPFNTYWFLYIGQTVSYLFIMLSLFSSSEEYLQRLVYWQIIASILLIVLLLLSPVIPPFTATTTDVRAIISGSRVVACLGIFCCYTIAFMKKTTRFSFVMSIAFLLLTFGHLMVVEKYFVANSTLFDNTGDITRLIGLAVLLVAVLLG